MRPVVGDAGLEVRLVLHRSGQAGIRRIHQRRYRLPGALLPGAQPLAAPLGSQVVGDETQRLLDEVALVVGLDGVGVSRQPMADLVQFAQPELRRFAVDPAAELPHAALGSVDDLLSHTRTGDPALRIPEIFLQQRGFGQPCLGQHVAGGESVHRVGDRDQGEGRGAVADRGEIGGFLRIRAEEDRVPRRQQRIDVVMTGHHVQRVLRHHASRDLQDEAAHLLADGDEV